MRFNPTALLVLVPFCVLLTYSLSSGSASMHIGEAVVTVVIIAALAGYVRCGGQRTR